MKWPTCQSMPTRLMEKHQKEVDHFKSLEGDAFDKEYASHAVKDHEMAIAEYTKASKEAKSAELKEFATGKLPKLKEHLKMAKALTGTEK